MATAGRRSKTLGQDKDREHEMMNDNDASTMAMRAPDASELDGASNGPGWYESSWDLQHGLQVCEDPVLSPLPLGED